MATAKPKAVLSRDLLGEQAMVDFGRHLGEACKTTMSVDNSTVMFLQGDLGTGKTTLSRGILQALGHRGAVKSPTYTLVEPYTLENVSVYHFDLYRLSDPEELEYMGIREYFAENSLCLVEWAEKARMFLPVADLVVRIAPIEAGRSVTVAAHTATGQAIINALRRQALSPLVVRKPTGTGTRRADH